MERDWHEKRHAERQARHDCGLPREVCSDPEAVLYPQREVCYATMEREAANAKYARLHEKAEWHDGTFKNWAAKPSAEFPYKYDWGVTIGVSETDLRPTDAFLTTASAPWPPPPEPGSDDEPDET